MQDAFPDLRSLDKDPSCTAYIYWAWCVCVLEQDVHHVSLLAVSSAPSVIIDSGVVSENSAWSTKHSLFCFI